jgi:hypothetical protein
VKRLTRLATERGREWKGIHTSVLSCLLAHRNRTTGHCWPARGVIAGYCRVSERTVDRVIAKLVEWGAIEKQQPRLAADGQFRPLQYAFLFELPDAKRGSPCDKNGRRRATKTAGAVRQKPGRNKEEAKDHHQAQTQGAANAALGSRSRIHNPRETLASSSLPAHDDTKSSLDRVLAAFEASPVTTGKAKACDRVTAQNLLQTFSAERIEYGILLASARRLTSFYTLDAAGREKPQSKVQTFAYFENAIAEAATDPNMTASYGEYLRHTLRKWERLQQSKKGAA